MKAVFRSVGIALAVAALSQLPAHAQDCAQILEELNDVSSTIARDANVYWEQRKAFIAQKSVTPKNAAQADRAAQLSRVAETKANAAKSAMPGWLLRFAALTSAAKSQKCLPPEQLNAMREPVFNLARNVNFDALPSTSATEGEPAEKKPPRMPTR